MIAFQLATQQGGGLRLRGDLGGELRVRRFIAWSSQTLAYGFVVNRVVMGQDDASVLSDKSQL